MKILITGVSSGFGLEMARALHRNGHMVYGAARRDCPALGEILEKFYSVDLCEPESGTRLAKQVLADAGHIDVLINNVGMGFGGALEETSDAELLQLFRLNFFVMTELCRAVLPGMRAQKGGYIINISSLGGRIGLPFQGSYSAAKYAVEGYSEALYNEVKPFGVHICLIEPGDFRTGFTGSRRRTEMAIPAYKKAYEHAIRRIEKDELGGSDPKELGTLVLKILNSPNPKLRYGAGGMGERMLVKLRGFLGDRLFLFLVRKYY